jgi:hypothetical protein
MFDSERTFRSWNAKNVGKPAGAVTKAGYILIRLQNHPYYAHRLIWLLTHGEPLPDTIDHADRNPANNRIDNLRAATNGLNMANILVRRDNKVGVKGVQAHGRGFMARIRSRNKEAYLGTFDTIEEATQAYQDAAARIHGLFARWD